jgi:hypothetical protein
MAKTLFVVDDDVFQALPEAAQKKLLSEVKDLFSFIPEFKVEARNPLHFPATLHFTDSVVSLVDQDIAVDAVSRSIRKLETTNVQFSIKQTGVHINLNTPPASFDGDPDAGGVGGHWKTVIADGGGTKVSITMTFGVASLESAEQAFLEDLLHGRTADDIRKERRQHKDPKWLTTKEGLQSTRDLEEAENLSKHKPLKEWPRDQWEDIATAFARIVAHEARHQYIVEHSSAGLGADSARVWGDQNFEAFDGTDQANIVTRIHDLNRSWDTASVHLETCPVEKASPFA